MEKKLDMKKVDNFNYLFTTTKTKKEFIKELETIYNTRYKKHYEIDGFRKGEVPFKVALNNTEIASELLELVAHINRQILIEQLIPEIAEIGSVYDIQYGEESTDFAGIDLKSEEDVVFQLNVCLASYVDDVDFEGLEIDKENLRTKKEITDEHFEGIYKEIKKVRNDLDEVTENSYVDLLFEDGEEGREITFQINKVIPEDEDELKRQTQEEIVELTKGKKLGDVFDYELKSSDTSTLDVKVTITGIYEIEELTDEEVLEMARSQSENKELTLEEMRKTLRGHVEDNNDLNYEEEVRTLTFAALKEKTTGIHYNETEIRDLQAQFLIQVRRMAEEEKKEYEEYAKENFGSIELMEEYVELSQKMRVLQAAIYRHIGKKLKVTPTYMQLESFVKTFIFRVDPTVELSEEESLQLSEQVSITLSDPLNRQRVVESWITMRAEDEINKIVGLIE